MQIYVVCYCHLDNFRGKEWYEILGIFDDYSKAEIYVERWNDKNEIIIRDFVLNKENYFDKPFRELLINHTLIGNYEYSDWEE